MKFILLTPPTRHPQEIALIQYFFEQGLVHLHIRKPQNSLQEISNYLQEIPTIFHPKIVVHLYAHQLQNEANLDILPPNIKGIHLSEHLRQQKIKLNDSFPIISTSFHRVADIFSPKKPYEYVFLSPIFDSISKTGHHAIFDKKALQNALSQTPNIVIALGGISPKRLEEVEKMGFGGYAAIGSVWQSENPKSSFLRLQNLGLTP